MVRYDVGDSEYESGRKARFVQWEGSACEELG